MPNKVIRHDTGRIIAMRTFTVSFVALLVLASLTTAPFQATSLAAGAWYSGGTLHKAKMKQWSRAPYADRLATSADFVTKMLQIDGKRIPPVNQLKPIAKELEICTSAMNKDGVADNQGVATMAATCWIFMKQ